MSSLPLSPRICWTAFVSTSRVAASFSKCRLFKFPSTPWNRNFGNIHHHCRYLSSYQSLYSRNEHAAHSKKLNVLNTEQKIELAPIENTVKKSKYEDELSGWTQIYRCDQIVAARLLQRFKIAQTAFTILMAAPLTVAGFVYKIVDINSVYMALGGSILASTMLYVVGNFFTRFIGHIYISKTENPSKTVRIARLDFWGGRVDEFLPIKDFVPLSEYVEDYETAYIKIKQHTDIDENDEYNITFKYGTVIDEEKFGLIFGGLPPS